MTGAFFAIVGPSGAGKDTLINYARNAMQDDARFVFPRRWITRPSDTHGEDHEVLSIEHFAQMKQDGAFFLEWQAHGLNYGIPAEVTGQLAQGISVVVNVSRAAIGQLCEAFQPVHVIQITAPPETIASRLTARQRETPHDIAQRIARAGYPVPDGVPVSTICNNGPIERAGAQLVSLLNKLSPPPI